MRQVSRFVADTPGDRFSDQRTKMFKELARLDHDDVLGIDERDAILRRRRERTATGSLPSLDDRPVRPRS